MIPMSAAIGSDPTDAVGRRMLAAVIDGVLEAAALFVGASFAGLDASETAELLAYGGATGTPEDGFGLLAGVLCAFFFVVLNRVVFQGTRGWTVGKLSLGLRTANVLGRPPGMVKALLRTIPNWFVMNLCGGLGTLLLLVMVLSTKGHRSLGDMAAKTFVISATYEGKMIITGQRKVHSGPASLTREEAAAQGYAVPYRSVAAGDPGPQARQAAEVAARAHAAAEDAGLPAPSPDRPPPAPAGVRAAPTWDASIRTWVVYDRPTGRWLKQRRNGNWVEID
jgi:uncharacterized RDD family membrane protein YckC